MIDYRCLSLWRPWPHTILHLGKRIENRGHAQYSRFRGWLLLHAAQSWDETCVDFAAERGLLDGACLRTLQTRTDNPTGIVGRCRVVGCVEPPTTGNGKSPAISAPNQALHDFASDLDFRWWMGGHGLLLDDVEALPEAIPCRGKQGLWRPPAEVVAQLPEQWRAVSAGTRTDLQGIDPHEQ
ncbi:MAG: hypothetical protein GVY18_03640 [Bacteroidetes bacterium]|jgi:hypothetical protein|nr:hypothetical protein [Bacteroidota bacterium]